MQTPNFNALVRLISYMKHHSFQDKIDEYTGDLNTLPFEEIIEDYAKEVLSYSELNI